MALLKSDLKICFKHIKVRDYNLKHTVMCIENVAELINGLKTCEVWQCVNNQGNAYIRAALILKKARHSSFNNKLIEYYEFYREIYKERLIKYGECHHLTKDGYNIILAFNELFCLELESLGYKIDHIWEK